MMVPTSSDTGRSAARAFRISASPLRALASLKLTLWLLGALGCVLALAYGREGFRGWPLALPLAGLAINLLAAVLTNAVFRRQLPLLTFHLALAALLLLVAAGRLSYLKGKLELTQGASFDGRLMSSQAGPLHAGVLSEVRFTNERFTIDYAPGLQRGDTRNTVSWLDGEGYLREAVIGDQTPLEIHGYRFYTSHNKGFAPVFLWRPKAGMPQSGAVHLPSYPVNELRQTQRWTVPGTARELWIMLRFDETVLPPDQPAVFRLPDDYEVIVREGADRVALKPGQSLELPEGTLTLDGLRSWMGYTVFYDWTLPWLAAASVLAVSSLGWHFWRKFAAKPWDA